MRNQILEKPFAPMQHKQILFGLVVFPLLVTTSDAPDAAPVRLTHDGYFKQRPAWSPDGKLLIFSRHEGNAIFLYKIPAADPDSSADDPAPANDPDQQSELSRLTQRKQPEYDAVWSPDGKRLAFTLVKQSGTQGDLEVYTMAADGSDLKPLATTGATLSHEESPAWSPGGKQIAFTSTRDGNQEIYTAGPDGSDVKRLTNDPALDAHPAWSPDGKRIVFATGRWGDLEVAVMDAGGGNLTRLTESQGLDDYPAFSPDGRHIAFTTNRDGNFEVYVMGADGTNPSNVTRNRAIDNFPAWHPAGDRLALVSNRGGAFDIFVVPVPADVAQDNTP